MSSPERRSRSGLAAAGTLALVLVATSAPAAEGRAVWIHAGMFSADENKARAEIVELLTLYQATGLNTLYCFDSLMAQHGKGWDFLAVLVDEAHRRGMTVHPVICPGHDVRLDGEIKEHPEWLIRGMKGEIYPNLNLASPGARWAEDGLVDVLCPMLYTSDARLFRSYVREAVRVGKGRARIYAGIACVSSHNKNTPDGVVQQVAIAREEGADGVAFFSGYSLGPEFRAALASAVFGKVPQRR